MDIFLFNLLGALVGFAVFGMGYLTRIWVDRANWHHAMDKLMAKEGQVDITKIRKEMKMIGEI